MGAIGEEGLLFFSWCFITNPKLDSLPDLSAPKDPSDLESIESP